MHFIANGVPIQVSIGDLNVRVEDFVDVVIIQLGLYLHPLLLLFLGVPVILKVGLAPIVVLHERALELADVLEFEVHLVLLLTLRFLHLLLEQDVLVLLAGDQVVRRWLALDQEVAELQLLRLGKHLCLLRVNITLRLLPLLPLNRRHIVVG